MLDHLLDRHPVHEHVEHRLLDQIRVQPLRHRQVALRVQIDTEDVQPGLAQRDSEVQRRRRLRDAAFLVCERDDLRACGPFAVRGSANVRAREETGESHIDRSFGFAQLIPSASSRTRFNMVLR
jgi:hypothetical protein